MNQRFNLEETLTVGQRVIILGGLCPFLLPLVPIIGMMGMVMSLAMSVFFQRDGSNWFQVGEDIEGKATNEQTGIWSNSGTGHVRVFSF